MTTRITVTTGDGGLLERNAQQQAANRQGTLVKGQAEQAAALGDSQLRAERIAQGRDPTTGRPLPSAGSTSRLTRIDQEPAAFRRDTLGFPHVFWSSSYIEDPTYQTNGTQEFIIATESNAREVVRFTYSIKPNFYYRNVPTPEPPAGKVAFMSLQTGPRVSRSNYNVQSDSGGSWFGLRPNNTTPAGEPGTQCRSYWNTVENTDGDAATPLLGQTSCDPNYGSMAQRFDSIGISRNLFTQTISFALPLSKDSLIFVCGIAEAADEGVLTSLFLAYDGWLGVDIFGTEAFGIVQNRNRYIIGQVPQESRLQLRAFLVNKTSIKETPVGTNLVKILESLLSYYTSNTITEDINASVEIDWRINITGSPLDPGQFVNPFTGEIIGRRYTEKIGERQAFAGSLSPNMQPFFQANLFNYGFSNLVDLAKDTFAGQNASPVSTTKGPSNSYTTPSVYTYFDLYSNNQLLIDTILEGQSTPLGLTMQEVSDLLKENNVKFPKEFYSYLRYDSGYEIFVQWTGELPEGVGFPSAGQSFSEYSAGWRKPIDDPGFRSLPERTRVKYAQDEDLFFNFAGCWNWNNAKYCRTKLIELGFTLST